MLDLAPYEVVLAGGRLIPRFAIREVDIRDIEHGRALIITTAGEEIVAQGFDAIEIIMRLKPSALEGKRLRWQKNAWAFHNLIAHPVMQIMVWLGMKKAAIALHDRTTPQPRDFR